MQIRKDVKTKISQSAKSNLLPKRIKIGVFDSGVGGLSVARTIQDAFKEHEVIYINDAENVPYGTKTPDAIYQFSSVKIRQLYEAGCDLIILACNTVTMVAKPRLERQFPGITFIGLDPMLKPAATATKTGKVIVCATPATLASGRYRSLKNEHAADIEVFEPDCSRWAELIEKNEITEDQITTAIEPGLRQGADVIVLACTHYHWIEGKIASIVGDKTVVLQPEDAVVRRIAQIIDR